MSALTNQCHGAKGKAKARNNPELHTRDRQANQRIVPGVNKVPINRQENIKPLHDMYNGTRTPAPPRTNGKKHPIGLRVHNVLHVEKQFLKSEISTGQAKQCTRPCKGAPSRERHQSTCSKNTLRQAEQQRATTTNSMPGGRPKSRSPQPWTPHVHASTHPSIRNGPTDAACCWHSNSTDTISQGTRGHACRVQHCVWDS